MKSRFIFKAIAILGLAANSSAVFADGGQAPALSTINGASAVDPRILQAAEQLLKEHAIEMTEDGNFVLAGSIVDTLRLQGRYSEASKSPGSICD